jgi:hypothetical protein
MNRRLTALALAAAACTAPVSVAAQAPVAAAVAPPMSLLKKSEAEVRARLGEPPIARREAGGAMWTYRLERCALFVFFVPQGREGLRVSGASAGPRKRGLPTPEVEACIASAPTPAPTAAAAAAAAAAATRR